MIGSRTWGALRPFAIRFTLLAILVGLFVSLPLALPDGTQAGFGTLTVNDTGDDNDLDEGDGVCEVTDGEGDCTLRAAIQEANESGLINTIDFDGNVFDPGTITLTKGSLPFVTKTGITIDASVNDVDVTLDVAGNDYGIGAVADENGFDFAVLGGGATLTIEDGPPAHVGAHARLTSTAIGPVTLSTQNRPIETVLDKDAVFRRYRVGTVNMEDYAIAVAARDAGVPFLAVRAVLDPADQSLPPYVLAMSRSQVKAVLGTAFRPWRIAPMLRLSRQMRQAQNSLTRFALAYIRQSQEEVQQDEQQEGSGAPLSQPDTWPAGR